MDPNSDTLSVQPHENCREIDSNVDSANDEEHRQDARRDDPFVYAPCPDPSYERFNRGDGDHQLHGQLPEIDSVHVHD